ncbi:sigma-54 interaction domain-containing protein [Carboxydothermus pertinax]|uniref:Sigma-54-dependent Fis family transcriptional regulator n=1 Tax=Carboxydothermus pertinax TaxID=870242 RepID=A0A1L8CXE3_9THEO|nr:sigma 54-interacting transcriptional regulator [Carboxydothermus pertinax]GAV23606.1 sigma-54-dependent Fis family transcriptional regulator [Carboxydothermus pertinax]
MAINPINYLSLLNIIDSIHNAIVAVDQDGIIFIFNKASERVFNYPAREAIGKNINEVLPFSGLHKVIKTGESHIGRKFKIGDNLYVVNRTPLYYNGQIIGAIGVAQEINELKNIADELENVLALKQTLETILEAGQEGYMVLDLERQVTHANKAIADLFGLKISDILNTPIESITKNPFFCEIPEAVNDIKTEVIEINGRQVVAFKYPIVKDYKLLGGVIKVIFQDVSDLLTLAEKINQLNSELSYYKNELTKYTTQQFTERKIIGNHPSIIRLKEIIKKIAPYNTTVLIRGESGTGKELVAHALHVESGRPGSFIKVNCAAIPENLLEAELFGYVEGAFTGAKKGGQIGKFELAHNGTIFLDEIGDMPLAMQAKLLRVLQEKEVERLGDNKTRKINVRVIAATNQDLEELIKQKKFREDLYYRLNVVSLYVPALRERIEDLPLLIKHFIDKFNREYRTKVTTISPEVMDIFMKYSWPGNIRELENVLERCFNLVEGKVIAKKYLPPYLLANELGEGEVSLGQSLPELIEAYEKELIMAALAKTKGNKSKAANLLGISRQWLHRRLKYFNLHF